MSKLTFGQKLMILRRNKNVSQKKLAELTKIGLVNIARYETDTIYPNAQTLIKLSDYFNVSIDYLLKDNQEILNINDKEILSLSKLIDELPEKNKDYLKKTIKQYLEDHE